MAAILVLSVPGAALMVAEAVPFAAACGAFAAALLLQACMWVDSFRPGRMTAGLWVLFAVLLAGFLFLPTPPSWVARSFRMPSGGMEPTLLGPKSATIPDHIIADRLCYRLGKPKRGDIIVFSTRAIPGIQTGQPAGDMYFFKRIVGLPGERIKVANGKIRADGRVLDEKDGIPALPYVGTIMQGTESSAKKEGDEYLVGQGEYFVMGDNSANSYDSRYWGCVPEANIFGKVTRIYYPFDRMGSVKAATK